MAILLNEIHLKHVNYTYLMLCANVVDLLVFYFLSSFFFYLGKKNSKRYVVIHLLITVEKCIHQNCKYE